MAEPELWQIWLYSSGIGLGLIFVIAYALHHFVALKSRPTERAAYTVGVSYLIVAAPSMFLELDGYEFIFPIAALPAALLVFVYWRFIFRGDWIENPDQLPEGVTLANDDWRVAIWVFMLAFVAVLPKAISFALNN